MDQSSKLKALSLRASGVATRRPFRDEESSTAAAERFHAES